MKLKNFVAICMLLTMLWLPSCNPESEKADNPLYNNKSQSSSEQSAKFIVAWWKALSNFVKSERLTPPDVSRMFAYIGTAMYESQICGSKEYTTLEGQLNGLKDLPRPNKDSIYDWTTVTTTSIFYVQDAMVARYLTAGMKAMNVLYDGQIAERAKTIPADVMERSKKYGREIADAIVDWSGEDGYEKTRYEFYKAPSREGHPELWAPVDFNQVPLEPFWGTHRTFAIKDGSQFDIDPKFKYSDDSTSEMWKQAKEVYITDKNLTEDQRNIALYWADDAGETFTPPGHWINIISGFVQTENMPLDKATEIYALSAIAMADACITVWHTKYRVDFLRPKTYINEHMEKGWEPYVETPPFAGYTSGHSGFSGSASTILTTLIGDKPFIDSANVIIGLLPKQFNSFKDAANEASNSRMYGGIHFRC
ncbi:MAG TPA: vanadium-dependent haloperoxidase, partial [Panacibacter sp.]|nr:vanadium-dependent haloperoxidase [Panacibacter sp.]